MRTGRAAGAAWSPGAGDAFAHARVRLNVFHPEIIHHAEVAAAEGLSYGERDLRFSFDDARYLGSASVNYSDKAFWSDVLNSSYHGFTDAYTMVNGSFGVKWNGGKVTTLVRATNLLNQEIQQHVFGDILKASVVGEVRFKLP